jgi:hypothetical protein
MSGPIFMPHDGVDEYRVSYLYRASMDGVDNGKIVAILFEEISFLLPTNWVVPLLTKAILDITLLPRIQITRSEESTQKTRRSSASRPGRSTKSRTS